MLGNNGATFSEDRMYRYALWRIWDESKPCVMFIGLNPSTANENTDDPTIRRVIRFAADWEYGGIYMMNLFGFVTAYPKILTKADDPVGENDKYLLEFGNKAHMIVCAWGNFKEAVERAAIVSQMFPAAYALQINKKRHP